MKRKTGLVPELKPEEIGKQKPSAYAVRFLFGAAISLVAGLIGIKFGPVVGGLLLGFPAILPASLTLIEKREGREQASIDSVGAILGAVAMIVFAVVVTTWVTALGVVATMLTALAVWAIVAFVLYAVVASVYKREPAPP
jgi:predicted neutral ceramidase superfamily lipid hydrolase